MNNEDLFDIVGKVIAIGTDAYIIFNYLDAFYERKMGRLKYYSGIFMYVLAMFLMSYMYIPLGNYLSLTAGTAIICLLAFFLYNGNIRTKIVTILTYLLFYLVGEMIVFYSINLLTIMTVEDLSKIAVNKLPFLIYDRILLFMLFKGVVQMRKTSHTKLMTKDFLALSFVSAISLYIILTLFLMESYSYEIEISMSLFISLGLFIANVIIFNLFQKSTKYARIEMEQSLILQNVESSEKRYGEVIAIQNQIKSMWHDINNHIVCVKGMIGSDQEEAVKYIDELEQKLGGYASQVAFGNSIIDTILYTKTVKAKELGIDIATTLDMDKNIGIHPVDLCTIFSNAIDNAIEACEEVESGKRFIRLKAVQNQGILYIKIANSSCARKKVGNEFRTTKREKTHHGIGLKSIQTAVDSYAGSMKTEYTDGIFELDILLNIK